MKRRGLAPQRAPPGPSTTASPPIRPLKLFFQILGGHRHLAWKLGEMAQGLRILRGFSPCPDGWAMVAAEHSAREALRMASRPECQFRWGGGEVT